MKMDRRILKTKKAIRNAFAELVDERDVNRITIKEIADVANIDRKTFYHYYSGIYELIDEIETELFSAFDAVMEGAEWREVLENPEPILKRLTEILDADMRFYGPLLRKENGTDLLSKLSAFLKEKLAESLAREIDPIRAEFAAEYVVSGMVAVYTEWYEKEPPLSIEEVTALLSNFATSGIRGLL